MIVEAAGYALRKNPPPRELELYFDCDRWRALPVSGGVLNQPAGLLAKMKTCANVYTAVKEYTTNAHEPGKGAAWKQKHPEMVEWYELAQKYSKDNQE